MIGQQAIDVERKTIAILRVLSNSPRPLGGRILARRLCDLGIDLGERAVRYHLKLMDERGLTRPVGRKDGRSITSSGLEELGSALLCDRVGLVTTRVGTLAYQSSFDPEKRIGKVPINVSLFSREEFSQAMEAMKDSFLAGFAISDLVAVAAEGERLGEVTVPLGKVGLATVSHIVVCGALLRAGIPVESRFGGIVQIRNHEALRFIDLIEYAGCSLDPSEVFIAGKMTSVGKAAREGNGKILASLCEIPAISRSNAEAIIKELKAVGMKGLVIVGGIGESLCQVAVAANKAGIVLADGLNPVAAAVETGTRVINHPMSGVMDFGRLGYAWH
jgi:repressor of nif and glnA expression